MINVALNYENLLFISYLLLNIVFLIENVISYNRITLQTLNYKHLLIFVFLREPKKNL